MVDRTANPVGDVCNYKTLDIGIGEVEGVVYQPLSTLLVGLRLLGGAGPTVRRWPSVPVSCAVDLFGVIENRIIRNRVVTDVEPLLAFGTLQPAILIDVTLSSAHDSIIVHAQ